MQQLERPSLPRPPLPFRLKCPRRAPLRCLVPSPALSSSKPSAPLLGVRVGPAVSPLQGLTRVHHLCRLLCELQRCRCNSSFPCFPPSLPCQQPDPGSSSASPMRRALGLFLLFQKCLSLHLHRASRCSPPSGPRATDSLTRAAHPPSSCLQLKAHLLQDVLPDHTGLATHVCTIFILLLIPLLVV